MADVVLNLDDLTLGEAEELEENTGYVFGSGDRMSAKVMSYIVYLVQRRNDPRFTLEDAKSVRFVDIKEPTKPDPTQGSTTSSERSPDTGPDLRVLQA